MGETGAAGCCTLGCCFISERAITARNKVLRTNSLIVWVLLASSRIKLALQAMRHQDRQAIGEVFVGLHRGVLLMLITFT